MCTVVRKRKGKKIALRQNEESCIICENIGSGLAVFNGQLLCAHCFEQMLEIRVGRDDIGEDSPSMIHLGTNEILSVA